MHRLISTFSVRICIHVLVAYAVYRYNYGTDPIRASSNGTFTHTVTTRKFELRLKETLADLCKLSGHNGFRDYGLFKLLY